MFGIVIAITYFAMSNHHQHMQRYKMKRHTFPLLTLILVLGLSAVVWGNPGLGLRLLNDPDLKLTTEQKNRIEEIRLEAQRSRIDLQAELEKKQLDLRQLMNAETPDREAVDRKIAEIAELRSQLMQLQIHRRLDIRALLTTEQRQTLDAKTAEFKSRRGFGGPAWGPPGGEMAPLGPRGPRGHGCRRGPGPRL